MPSPQANAQSNVNDQENKLRGLIESGFGDLFGQYDQQAGVLPSWQQEDESSLRNAYSSSLTGLTDSRANATKTLDLSKQQVQSGVDKSVSDIGASLRALLKNAQGMIGSYGAGSSSAAQQQVPYAFSKMYGQQRGDIQGQANNQFVELDKKGLDVENQFNTQKMQLDQWEGTNMTATKDKYRNLLMGINNARASATGQRAMALQGLQENILNQARNELGTIQSEAANQRQMVLQANLQRQNQTAAAAQQMAAAAQYSPTGISYQGLTGLNNTTSTGDYEIDTMTGLRKKKTS